MKKTIALALFVFAAALAAYAEICVVPYPAKVVEKEGVLKVAIKGGKPDFDDFKRRAAVQRAALVAAGVNAAPFE